MSKTTQLFLLIVSLWVLWGVRAHHILALPVFVDESLHILRAQIVFDFTDAVASFLPGKLLLNYYLGVFQPQDHNGIWLSRQAVALLAPISAALCYRITRYLTHSFWTGFVVIWLYALTPYLVFFERLALADPLVLVFTLGLVWAGLLFARQPDVNQAAVVGMLLGAALLAKLTALPLVMVPILALWYKQPYPPRFNKLIFQKLIFCYAVTGLMMVMPLTYTLVQTVVGTQPEVVSPRLYDPSEQSRIAQIGANIEAYGDAVLHLTGLPLLCLIILGILYGMVNRREVLYLLAILGAAWGFIILLSANPSPRYLVLAFPLLLIAAFLHPKNRYMTATAALVIGGWMIFFALPFTLNTWHDPAQLKLGKVAEGYYIRHNISGYALRDIGRDIQFLDTLNGTIPITGFVVNCHSLRLYLPEKHPIKLNCPYLPYPMGGILNSSTPAWSTIVENAGYHYFLVDYRSINTLTEMGFTPELVRVYQRPRNGVQIALYRVRVVHAA